MKVFRLSSDRPGSRRGFSLKTDCTGERMARPGNNVHIPLKTDKAISLLLRVKPTSAMPRPGAHPTKSRMAKLDEEFGAIDTGRRAKRKT